MAALRSRRPGGLHLYYSDTQSRGNTRFEVYGCKGDIRSTGYIILWHDGADLLADALTDPIARSRSWPVDLFDAAGLGAVTEPDGAKFGSQHTNNEATRKTWAAAGIELELVRKGQRHIQLFDAVRFWSYSVTRNDSKEAWTRRVTVRALEQNNRFSDGLPIGEVASLASKVADWTWKAGGRRLNHSKEVQRRRGIKSGRVLDLSHPRLTQMLYAKTYPDTVCMSTSCTGSLPLALRD